MTVNNMFMPNWRFKIYNPTSARLELERIPGQEEIIYQLEMEQEIAEALNKSYQNAKISFEIMKGQWNGPTYYADNVRIEGTDVLKLKKRTSMATGDIVLCPVIGIEFAELQLAYGDVKEVVRGNKDGSRTPIEIVKIAHVQEEDMERYVTELSNRRFVKPKMNITLSV